MKIKALIVEDNATLNKSISNLLKKEGFEPSSAHDINGAKEMFLIVKPHIVLLDIMLPGGRGYDLIEFFRIYNDSQILMLTALDDEQSKRIAYENGADDYITKPFDLYELAYKLAAVKRRILSNLREINVGDILIDLDTNQLTCGEKSFFIQPSQTKLLKILYEKYATGNFLDKAEASDFICEGVDENPRLQTLVARTRKNLSTIGSKYVTIETIYNKGYELTVSSLGETFDAQY